MTVMKVGVLKGHCVGFWGHWAGGETRMRYRGGGGEANAGRREKGGYCALLFPLVLL